MRAPAGYVKINDAEVAWNTKRAIRVKLSTGSIWLPREGSHVCDNGTVWARRDVIQNKISELLSMIAGDKIRRHEQTRAQRKG